MPRQSALLPVDGRHWKNPLQGNIKKLCHLTFNFTFCDLIWVEDHFTEKIAKIVWHVEPASSCSILCPDKLKMVLKEIIIKEFLRR